MNDITESNQHRDDLNRVFSLCFCNSESLNIPVFYLYGGIDGKGCRIQFTDSKLRKLINDCELYYVNKKNRCLKHLIPKDEYEIMYDWIYYISSDGYCEHHNDLGKHYDSFEQAVNELTESCGNYFVKNTIWKYENEFRIVVRFNKDVSYERIALKFNIRSNEKGISVKCGPEITNDEFNDIKNEFLEYDISKIEKSSQGKIPMRLVEKNSWLYNHKER